MAFVVTFPIMSVWPSGFPRVISSMARMPNAPGLFSITKDWPRIFFISSPSTRATRSVAPPGA